MVLIIIIFHFKQEIFIFISRENNSVITLLNAKIIISKFLAFPLMEVGDFESIYPYHNVVIMLLITPIIEEIIFRYSILKEHINKVILILFLVYISDNSDFLFFISLIIIPVLIHTTLESKTKLILYITIVSSMAFGISHSEDIFKIIYFSVSGVLYSLVRMKYGLHYSIIIHILYNTYTFFLSWILRIL